MQMVLQNLQASMPLTLAVDVVCNTPEEKILSNVLINALRDNVWVKMSEPHDGIAVICGSGPSLADCIDDIRHHQIDGCKIFALNGAASFLGSQRIHPDYQVIMDAQPRTAAVIGPAKAHLFASQVDPSLFDIVPDATVWHATYGNYPVDEQEGFPKRNESYCVIGAFSSVGNTALVLLYAMGYRNIHVYGMDSSQRDGASHAQHQKINDDDINTVVDFNGKPYICSLTMKLQADGFMNRARELIRGGCAIAVHGSGLLPDMWNEQLPEQEKYQRMWGFDAYRSVSPGEQVSGKFLEVVRPDGLVIDFGCGTGRGALAIKAAGHAVHLIDFTDNSRDPEARDLPFLQWDLTKKIPLSASYGYCTDVMEHIPEKDVDAVIWNIMDAAKTVFFQISTVPDSMGALIGRDLHLTVRPHEWWIEKFIKLGYEVQWQECEATASLFVIVKPGR